MTKYHIQLSVHDKQDYFIEALTEELAIEYALEEFTDKIAEIVNVEYAYEAGDE
jgi:hypothetical protein